MATARDLLTWPQLPAADPGESAETLGAMLGRKRIILASNRGPVQYSLDRRGELVAQRGEGGLVTALTALLRHARVSWVASSMSAGDRVAARRLDQSPQMRMLDDRLRLRLVNVPDLAYRRHYEVFSNPVLWLLQHSLADSLVERPATLIKEAWRWGYVPVNHALARTVLEEMQAPDTAPWVFTHDYHLYLTGHFIRQQAPHAFLQHFTHIPWPVPGEGQRLLGAIWQEILHSLLAHDILGFQTQRDAVNFMDDCRESLPSCQIDSAAASISYSGRRSLVRSYPISVDVAAIREDASSIEYAAYRHKLASLCTEFTIVKVERVDPTKNTAFSLETFRRLLQARPELVGRASMLAFLVPSRTTIAEYRQFTQQVMSLVGSINAEFGAPGYLPVRVFYENNYLQALAGMSLYDVLLVNPVADGMNLVAKEGPMVNRKEGVVVLSETAGAHSQLSGAVLSVRPDDLDGTAEAMYRALRMPVGERRRRAASLRASIEREDLTDWIGRQLRDVVDVLAEQSSASRKTAVFNSGYLTAPPAL